MDTFIINKNKSLFLNIFNCLLGKRILFLGNSIFNGEIVVVKDFFGTRLIASHLTQSGGMVEFLWTKAVNKISHRTIERILILGLGAGSCLAPINRRWPEAKLVGVEIDPLMIELGGKFFSLLSYKLEIEVGDAADFISQTKNQYDLILVDLFSGEQHPKFVEENRFLENIKMLLTHKGFLIFNRLYFGDHKEPSKQFLEKLKKYFAHIETLKIPRFFPTNLLILCQA